MGNMNYTNLYRQQVQSAIQRIIILIFIGYLLVVGTDFLSIVLWKNRIANQIEVLILAPILATTLIYYRHLFRGIFASPEISALVVLALFSIFWSGFPMNLIQRTIPLIVTTAFALTLASMMSARGLLLLFATFFAASMILALTAIITLPQARGIPPWVNTWNGIYLHKNEFGVASTMSLITSYYASRQVKGGLRLIYLFIMAISLLFLVVSESRTSQVIAIICMSALLIRNFLPRSEIIWAIGFIVASVLVVASVTVLLISPYAEPLFAIIGRRPTLSERIPLWELVWPNIVDRFWLGYGYTAYWYGESTHLRSIVSKGNLGFRPYYSHNGLLETFLNTGFVGVTLLFLALFRVFVSLFYCLFFTINRDVVVFSLVLIIMFIFLNITESLVLGRMSAGWILFIACTTKINLVAKAIRFRVNKMKYAHT